MVTTDNAMAWFQHNYPGLKHSRGRSCPHWLLSKRCQGAPCVDFGGLPLDHVDGWTFGGKPAALTSQPYQMHTHHMVSLGRFVRAHDLLLTVTANSWHNPGSTILIVMYYPIRMAHAPPDDDIPY